MTTGTALESRDLPPVPRGYIRLTLPAGNPQYVPAAGLLVRDLSDREMSGDVAEAEQSASFVICNGLGFYVADDPDSILLAIDAALDPAPVTGEGRPSIDIVLDMIRSLGKADGRLGVYSYNQLESEMLNAYLAGSAEGEASRAR